MLQITWNVADNPLHSTVQDAASTVQTRDSRPNRFKYHASAGLSAQTLHILYK